MFEGAVIFTYSIYGWRVIEAIKMPVLFTKIIPVSMFRYLVIQGHFSEKPRCGTYCKRPHHLLEAIV